MSLMHPTHVFQIKVSTDGLFLPDFDFGDWRYEGRIDFFCGESNDGSIFPNSILMDVDIRGAKLFFRFVHTLSHHFFNIFRIWVVF